MDEAQFRWLQNYFNSLNDTVADGKNGSARGPERPTGLYLKLNKNIDITLPVQGYITPVLCVAVLISNVLFIVVFAKRNMNSPTHIVLRAIAVADTLTILLPTPCFIYVYTLKNFRDFLPYHMCWAWDYSTVFLPTMTHTASVWLTTMLAVQRYICVSYPLKVRLWCGIKRTYIMVVIIFVLAVGCHFCRFFEHKYDKAEVQSKLDQHYVQSCVIKAHAQENYLVAYSCVRALLVNIFPCVGMFVFSTIMLVRIRLAERRRRVLRRRSTFGSGENEPRESRTTTWLVIVIVSLVFIVEVPVAAFFVIYAIHLTTGKPIIPDSKSSDMYEIISNLVVQTSYPLHFVLYCSMSEGFRKAISEMFTITYRNDRCCCFDHKRDDECGSGTSGRLSLSLSVLSTESKTSSIFTKI